MGVYPPQGTGLASELVLPALIPNVGEITGTAYSGTVPATLGFSTYDTTGTLQSALMLYYEGAIFPGYLQSDSGNLYFGNSQASPVGTRFGWTYMGHIGGTANTGTTPGILNFYTASASPTAHPTDVQWLGVSGRTWSSYVDPATAAVYRIIDGSTSVVYLSLDSRKTTDNVNTFTITSPAPTITSASTTTYSLWNAVAYTLTLEGGVSVTGLQGLQSFIGVPTVAATSTTTVATASTLFIAGAPVAGAGVTITNTYALLIGAGGALGLTGSTSGVFSMTPAATTTSYTVTWPAAQASGTQLLQNDGAGNLSWATVAWSALTKPTANLSLSMATYTTTWATTSTAWAAGTNSMFSITSSGANANTGVTVQGLNISVTNTNATSGTNTALALSASGATTNNYAINVGAGYIYSVSSIWSIGNPSGASSAMAYGYQALNVSTGSGNAAFGYQTLYSNTTGWNNSAFGYQALYSNTTGGYNSAFGNLALYSNTTGLYNSAFGYQTLYLNTTGSNNSAFGYQALYSNTTGLYNYAFGYQTLYLNTTGGYNSAFGYIALFSNTTGGYNSAFGYQALFSNTTGGYNSAFGNLALGQFNNTASSNTYLNAFGYKAGYNYTGAEANNIVIGYNLGVLGESNMLRIGNPAIGATYGQIALPMLNLTALGVPGIYGTPGLSVNLGTTATQICTFTPPATGMYSVRLAISCKTASTVTITISYTDPNAGTITNQSIYSKALSAGQTDTLEFNVTATSASAIVVNGTDSVALGDAYVSGQVERLQ